MIYLDYNSTAPYSPLVRAYLKQGILEDWYDPSWAYLAALCLHEKIDECRQYIADYLSCSPKHLFFTSGATESINTVLSLETLRQNNMSGLISATLEHKASLNKIDWLNQYSKNKAHNQAVGVHYVPHNEQGEISLSALEKICSKHPQSLLSFLSANNETGVITDIQAISKIAKKYSCLLHVDAVQSLGKVPIDLTSWDIDFASFSGHKIGAMKGMGLLYAKKPFSPLMHGGGQEKGLRPGTQNYPAIYSFKLAIQDIDLQKQESVKKLRDYLESHLPAPFKINCQKVDRLPNSSNIYCGGLSNYVALLHLAKKGLAVSSGSACSAGSPEPSHVMSSLFDKDYARSCLRISLSPYNTKSEIDFLIHSLKEITQSSQDFHDRETTPERHEKTEFTL